MATVDRYVDPAATGGGTGLDWTNAYTSLSAWEAAEQTDLVTDGDIHVCHCRSSGANPEDTTAVVIDGWTTGASNYIEIRCDSGDGHSGTWDDTKYRLVNTAGGYSIDIREAYVRLFGLQLHYDRTGGGGALYVGAGNDLGDVRIGNCLLYSTNTAAYICRVNQAATTGTGTVTFYNTILYANTAQHGLYAVMGSSQNCYIYNCLITGVSDDAIETDGTNVTAINTVSFNNADDFKDVFSSIDYCASDDGDGTNGINWTSEATDWNNNFTSYSPVKTTADYSLVSGSADLVDAGTDDPGAGLYSDDIAGNARSSPWDIGPFEWVTAGAVTLMIMGGDGIHSKAIR